MTVALWIIVGLLAVLVLIGLAHLGARPPAVEPVPPAEPVVDRLVREKVLVTLKSGASFGGVLWESDERGLVIRNVEAYGTGQSVEVDGEVFVFARDVDYIQKP